MSVGATGLCPRCLRERRPDDPPLGPCLDCDPKGPNDELPDPSAGHMPNPLAMRAHAVMRATKLHPKGWVTAEHCRDLGHATVRLIELRRRYPDEKYRIEVVE